jgi:hypothetical protein
MYAFCQDLVGVTQEEFDAVGAAVGDVQPAGLVAHVAGPTGDGFRIIDVWESREAWETFRDEVLQPAVQRSGVARLREFDVRDVMDPRQTVA